MTESLYTPSDWQSEYHRRTEDWVLGAGSSGPGKSLALLHDCDARIWQEHERCINKEHPYYHPMGASTGWALHLRRTRPMLEQTIARSQLAFKTMDPGARYDTQSTTWHFSSGYRYQFGHCRNDDDWGNYLSNQYDWLGFDEMCVHPDTDVLTDTGWKRIATVVVGEKVLSLSKGGKAEYHKVANVYSMPFDGELISTANKAIQFAITPKHNMPIVRQGSETWEMCQAEALPTWPRYPFHAEWSGQELNPRYDMPIPEGRGHGPNSNSAESVQLLDWVEFLGWYLSEGCCFMQRNYSRKRGASPVVKVSQTKPCPGLDALMRRLPWRVRSEGKGRTGYAIFSRQLYDLVRPFGDSFSKRVPRWLLNGTTEILATFLDAFAQGDGAIRPNGGVAFGLCNTGLIDDLQEIAVKLGRRATRRTFTNQHGYVVHHVNIYGGRGKNGPCMDRPGNKRTVRYKGPVHCLNVPCANTFLARYNGRMFWSGNTQFNQEQFEQLWLRVRSDDPVLGPMCYLRAMSTPFITRGVNDNFTVNDPGWVKRMFVDPAPQGGTVIVRKVKLMSGKEVTTSRLYLRATLWDNPNKQFVEDYEKRLQFSKPHLRDAYLHGRWDVTVGSFFGDDWDHRLHVCKPFKISSDWPVFRSMDWGYKKPGCVHWWALDEDDNLFCIREYTFKMRRVDDVAFAIERYEKEMGWWDKTSKRSKLTGPADTQLWEERGDMGIDKATEFRRLGVSWLAADKHAKRRNASRLMDRLRDHDGGTTTPGIVFFNTCVDAVRTIPAIPTDPERPEDVLDGGDDHWYDSTAYACAYASVGRKGIRPIPKERDPWEDEKEDHADRGRHGYYGH